MAYMLTMFQKLVILLIVSFILMNENSFATNQTNDDLANELPIDLIDSVNTFNNSNQINFETHINSSESKQFDETNQTKLELLAPNLTPVIDSNTTNVTINNNNSESKVNCTPIDRNSTNNETTPTSQLILVNSTRLANYLQTQPNISQTHGAQCALVVFYYKSCPFSAKSAKHLNALGRIYPQFDVLAIDAYQINSLNMRYGLVGVPSILFFHNGKIVGKLNHTDPTIEGLVTYINQLTGISPVMPPNITEQDLLGPLSSEPETKFDYILLFSWIFSITCFAYMFAKSNLFKTIVETVRNAWREAEAQHEHID